MTLLLQILLAAIVYATAISQQGLATEQAAPTSSWAFVEDPDLLPDPRVIEIGDTPWRVHIQFTEPESVRRAIDEGRTIVHEGDRFFRALRQEGSQIVYRPEDRKEDQDHVVMEMPRDLELFSNPILRKSTNLVELTGRTTGAEPTSEIRFYRVDPPSQPRLLLTFGQSRIPGAPGLSYYRGWMDERHYVIEGGIRLSIQEELERRERLGILQDVGISADGTPYKERYLFIYDALDDVQYLHQIKDPLLISTHWGSGVTANGWYRAVTSLEPQEKLLRASSYLRIYRIDLDPDLKAEPQASPNRPPLD